MQFANLPKLSRRTLKIHHFFIWHASCNEDGITHSRVAKKGKMTMTNISNARQTAVSLAAAFVTAMIFVSSAVGPAAQLTFA